MATTEAAHKRTGPGIATGAVVGRRRRRPSDFACKQVMAWTGLVFGVFVLVPPRRLPRRPHQIRPRTVREGDDDRGHIRMCDHRWAY
jgi:hypothetical protein